MGCFTNAIQNGRAHGHFLEQTRAQMPDPEFRKTTARTTKAIPMTIRQSAMEPVHRPFFSR
jgi:hypothetical protein